MASIKEGKFEAPIVSAPCPYIDNIKHVTKLVNYAAYGENLPVGDRNSCKCR